MATRILLALLIAASSPALAQPYRWTDSRGRVHFGDAPPPAAAKGARVKAPAAAPAPAPGTDAQQPVPFEVQRLLKDFPVTLYTAPICKQPCELARAALNKRGVPFTEVQVWNQETLDQLKSKAGSDNVPALTVGRSAQSGFDQARFDALLDSAGFPPHGSVPARAQRAPAAPEGYEPPPTAEPLRIEAEAPGKTGPYDATGFPANRSDKPGPYDPSGLKSDRPEKRGQYGLPGSAP